MKRRISFFMAAGLAAIAATEAAEAPRGGDSNVTTGRPAGAMIRVAEAGKVDADQPAAAISTQTIPDRQLYDPPPKPERPISADYPAGMPMGEIKGVPVLVEQDVYDRLIAAPAPEELGLFGFKDQFEVSLALINQPSPFEGSSGHILLAGQLRDGVLVLELARSKSDPPWTDYWKVVDLRESTALELMRPLDADDIAGPATAPPAAAAAAPPPPDLFPGFRNEASVNPADPNLMMATGVDPVTNERWYEYRPKDGLADAEVMKWMAYVTAHILNDRVGHIPTDGLMDELEVVYTDLNAPPGGDPVKPEDFGLTGEQVDRDYIAEAIRAYMTDPNYLKTVAPKTAKAIRDAVNPNARVNATIQFN